MFLHTLSKLPPTLLCIISVYLSLLYPIIENLKKSSPASTQSRINLPCILKPFEKQNASALYFLTILIYSGRFLARVGSPLPSRLTTRNPCFAQSLTLSSKSNRFIFLRNLLSRPPVRISCGHIVHE